LRELNLYQLGPNADFRANHNTDFGAEQKPGQKGPQKHPDQNTMDMFH